MSDILQPSLNHNFIIRFISDLDGTELLNAQAISCDVSYKSTKRVLVTKKELILNIRFEIDAAGKVLDILKNHLDTPFEIQVDGMNGKNDANFTTTYYNAFIKNMNWSNNYHFGFVVNAMCVDVKLAADDFDVTNHIDDELKANAINN